jgi:aspartokinase
MEKSLEGPRVLSLALQKGLTLLDAEEGVESEKLQARFRDAGVKVFGWETGSGRLRLLVERERELDAARLLEGRSPLVQRGLARVTAVGAGLLNSPELCTAFHGALRSAGLVLRASVATPVALEALVEESPRLDEALASAHAAILS